MPVLYAQPYNTSVDGFFFESFAEYKTERSKLYDGFGQFMEELQIYFIDGDNLDRALFEALSIHQGNIDAFLNACDDWDAFEKIKVIIAVGEVGYAIDLHKDSPDDFEVDIYEIDSLKDLAYEFVDEGLFGEIPERLQFYLDYETIARDLSFDYAETTIAGRNFVYRAG